MFVFRDDEEDDDEEESEEEESPVKASVILNGTLQRHKRVVFVTYQYLLVVPQAKPAASKKNAASQNGKNSTQNTPAKKQVTIWFTVVFLHWMASGFHIKGGSQYIPA